MRSRVPGLSSISGAAWTGSSSHWPSSIIEHVSHARSSQSLEGSMACLSRRAFRLIVAWPKLACGLDLAPALHLAVKPAAYATP